MNFFLFILLLCTYSFFGQDLTQGLRINDLSPHPMQVLDKPGYLQTVTDPSFNTTIRRITNASPGGIIKPLYSTIQPWNADESLLIVFARGMEQPQKTTSTYQLLDGNDYTFIRNLDDVNPDDIEQLFWDFDNPNWLYYVDRTSGHLIRYSVTSKNKETLIDLKTATNCADISLGGDVQMPSRDGTVFSFRCGNEKAFYYHTGTNKLTEFEIDDIKFTAPMPGPSGTLFYHDKNIYNSNGQLARTLDLGKGNEHACLGQLANGNDAYFSVVFSADGCQGNIVAHDMVTGTCIPIISQELGYPYALSGTHISALAHKNTESGWIAASMIGYDKDGQKLLDQELIIANADPNNPKVCRIAHHRSDEDDTGFAYWGEPHAAISPTGTRVLFGSDWSGSEDGQSIDTYVVELPAHTKSLTLDNFDNVSTTLLPNPFSDKTTLTIKNTKHSEFELAIYTLQGQLIKTILSTSNEIVVNREGLQEGLSIYILSAKAKILKTGTIVLK